MSSTPTTPTAPAPTPPPPAAAPSSSMRRWFFTLAALLIVFGVGYLIGREVEKRNRYDTYWLLGATLSQDLDGVYVDYVYPGGPSDVAGLAAGDRIGAIDGRPVTNAGQARRFIGEHNPGDSVQITFRRGSFSDQVSVVLGFMVVMRPDPNPDPVVIRPEPTWWPTYPPPPVRGTSQEARLGVYYRMLEPGDPFSVENGALIITAFPGSPADRAGLAAGDIIVKVEDHQLSQSLTLEDALSRYADDNTLSVTVLHADGDRATVRVQLQQTQ